jgi:hypothetical protein
MCPSRELPPFREIQASPAGPKDLEGPPRSARLPRFISLAPGATARLDELDLAVIGAGSIGRQAALSAARLAPGTIRLIDPARLKAESLLTHPVLPQEIGESKVESAGRALKAISPRARVLVFEGRLQDLGPLALADCTLILLATDNLNAEVDAGQVSLHLGIPLIQASVHGESLTAQVRFFENRTGAGPCPACWLGPAEWDFLSGEIAFPCAGGGGGEAARVAPTMSTAFLSSLAADLALTQATRFLLGLGAPVGDTLLHWNGYTHAMHVSPLRRNTDCPCEHVPWTRARVPGALSDLSLREIARAAGCSRALEDREPSFQVGGLRFFEAGICCGRIQETRRFSGDARAIGRCARCQGPLSGGPFHSRREVPGSLVDLDAPLSTLGAGSADFVTVRVDGRAFLVS